MVLEGDRKIVHWRDYMDSLAAWNALTAPLAYLVLGEQESMYLSRVRRS
jgi:hypothetical protein